MRGLGIVLIVVLLASVFVRGPMIRFLWGGGLAGHWGIVVGNPNMNIEIPKAQDLGLREDRRPLAPGAYTWFRE